MLKFKTVNVELKEDLAAKEPICAPALVAPARSQSLPKPTPWATINFVVYSVVIAIALGGGTNFTRLGMDWGYDLIERLFGQPAHNDQYWGAIFLSHLVAPVIFGSASLGALASIIGGKKRWWLLSFASLACGIGALAYSDSLEAWPIAIGAWLVAGVLFNIFRWIHRELSFRTHASKLMACSLIPLLPMVFLDGQIHLPLGLPMYVTLLFVASLVVPMLIKTSKRDAAVSASLFAFLPITLFNIANVIFATINITNLGWQAAASAATITLVTALITTLGARAGCKVYGRGSLRSPSPLLSD